MAQLQHSQTLKASSKIIPAHHCEQSGPLEVWRAACGTIFGASPLNHKPSNLYRAETWFVDPIIVAKSQYHPMVSKHTNHHIYESGNYLNVHRFVTRSPIALDASGLPILCEPGSIILLDYSRPFTSIHPRAECQSFIVPHSAIGYTPSDETRALKYPTNSKMGQLIGQEMDLILDRLIRGDSAIAQDDLKRFLGCVEVAASPQRASPSARQYARGSLKRAIQTFVETHLASPDLNVTLILRNFGVSRASLYRMFEVEDGVRNYINMRRICRAVIDLAVTPHQRGVIQRTSERWGFTSDASFNRMVRRNFGLAPGALFEMPLTMAAPSAATSLMHGMAEKASQRILVEA